MKFASLLLILCFAIPALYIAIPKLGESIAMYEVFPIADKHGRGEQPTDDEIIALINAYAPYAAKSANTKLLSDLADFHAYAIESKGIQADYAKTTAIVDALQLRSLLLMPYDPWGWIRMSQSGILRGKIGDEIAPLIELSLKTGRYEKGILFRRLRHGLAYYNFLSGTEQLGMLEQIRLAWRVNYRILMPIVIQQKRIEIARAAFAHDEESLRQFEVWLGRYQKNMKP